MELRPNNRFDRLRPGAAANDDPNLDQSDPVAFFKAIGCPIPKMMSLADVRREVAVRSCEIFITYQTLHEILQRHEALIEKHWSKKSRQQRLKILLSAWPNMAAMHHPDFEAFVCHNKGSKYRDSYVWPYINQEDLLNTKTLPLLLNARGRHHPSNFAAMDFNATHIGRASKAIRIIFLHKHTMIMNGLTENISDYGILVAWSEHPDAFDWVAKRKQCIPGEGLIILEAQERLLTFLLECCKHILHDIPKSNLTSESFPVLPEPPLKPENDISGFESLSVMAEEAPYRVPAQLDLRIIESLLAAKASAADDHVWALREDPDYFSRTLHEARDHRQEILKDCNGNGNAHPLLGHGQSKVFWAHIIVSVVSKAYLDLELFSELNSQAKKLASLQRQYASDILPSRDLPEYLNALLRFRYYLNHGAKEQLSNLKCALVASPPLRKYFARQSSPNADSTNIVALLKLDARKGKVEERLLWLLHTLCEDGPALLFVLVDELEKMLQTDTKVRGMLSSYVTTLFGDISIISQCLHQLGIYYPWAGSFDAELVKRGDRFGQDHAERTKPWALILTGLRDASLLNRAAILGEPSGGKFTYPIEKRHTKENVEALRTAESHLDDFWAAMDQAVVAKTGNLGGIAVRDLLSQPRILHRTPEWVALTKRSCGQPTEGKSKTGDADSHFSHHSSYSSSWVESTLPSESLDVLQHKTKPKTRGKPNPSTSITAVENLIQPTHSDLQPTFSVDAHALRVFRIIFFNPDVTSLPGEVAWNDFVHAMSSIGFVAMKLYGSVWQFQPTGLDIQRSIQFHEPHPRGKLPFRVARFYGRRLNRAYGWVGGTFSLTEK
ncbi:unnamed protein product [Penicillium glandicola]